MAIASEQSRAIFRQLAQESQPGVQCVIENHDAWVNSADVAREVGAAIRERIARSPRMAAVSQRIREQRTALAGLAIVLPSKAKSAG